MNKDTIFSLIKKHIIDILPSLSDNDIQATGKMADLGLNSIDRAEVLVAVMEELKIKIPLISLGKMKNINDVVEVFFQAVDTNER